MNSLLKLLCFFFVSFAFGQEDEVMRTQLQEEQQEINFDTFFYEALQQKAIGNFDKAIYALEECQDIDGENLAVMFEFSKNYFELSKYTESEYYANKALEIQPKNVYILRHLKEINLRQSDYEGAIKAQLHIIALKPDEEPEMIYIFIQAGKMDEARDLLNKLILENRLPDSFDAIKQSLLQVKTQNLTEPEVKTALPRSNLDMLKDVYKEKKDYKSLVAVLENELKTKQFSLLMEDSKLALSLYPEQAYVYLMHGIALNSFRKYREAIDLFENGMEWIADDPNTEAKFYEQLSLSHKALGENVKATEYYNKMIKLKDGQK
jgi:tetratricopeptide (TPR) repeat protein